MPSHSGEVPGVIRLLEAERRTVAARAGDLCLMGTECGSEKMRRPWRWMVGMLRSSVNALSATELYPHRWVTVNFMLCIFQHIKEK